MAEVHLEVALWWGAVGTSCFGGSAEWWPMRAAKKVNINVRTGNSLLWIDLSSFVDDSLPFFCDYLFALKWKNNSHCIRKWISSPSLGPCGPLWPNLQNIQLQYWTRISSWGVFNIRGKPAQILQVTILMIVHSNSIHIILYLMMQWFNTHIIIWMWVKMEDLGDHKC
jgi:hypothetical protein